MKLRECAEKLGRNNVPQQFSRNFDHVGYALSEVRRLYRESLVDDSKRIDFWECVEIIGGGVDVLDKAVSGGKRSEVDKEVEGLVDAVIGRGDGESRIPKGEGDAVEQGQGIDSVRSL